jgi:hypothetical protein
MRLLTEAEIGRLYPLSSLNTPLALLEVTATGLEKSIMDATEPVRKFLSEVELHDFGRQVQGTENKVLINTKMLRPDGSTADSVTSFYRPRTKKGDPRLWVYGLKFHADPSDIIALAFIAGQLWVVNLTAVPLDSVVMLENNEFAAQLAPAYLRKMAVVNELTEKLIVLNELGFIPAVGVGDNRVGNVLEAALGIAANSSRAPDYHGIELKAFRVGGRTATTFTHSMKRRNLFAKTPDWSISRLKSSREILDSFGYDREDARRLYCEVRATKPNTQGLQFHVDESRGLLNEVAPTELHPDVVTWRLEELESALAAKHDETFWVGAESQKIDGVESFRYVVVEHTQRPLVEQFGPLVRSGAISMDHLIKGKLGRVSEKGPIFKLDNSASELLFPSPRLFSLSGPPAG